MMDEQNQAIKAALLPLLEPSANGNVQISIAISLKKISDRMLAEEPKVSPPKILHR
jgi:hypothetical protein